MVSKKKFLGHLRTTTSLTALAFVLGAFPAHAASADCKDGDRTNDNRTCTVNDPDVTHVHVVTYSDEDHNPNHSDSGETGDYTLNVDVPLSTDGHDHTVLLQQNGGQGDDGGDPGADGDDVTLNLDASVSQGPHEDDDPQYGALVPSIGGPGEAGESDKADHTQGGDGGDGGTVTINSGTAGFVSVTGDANDGLIGVAGWSQGGPGLDQADRGKLLVDETGGDGGDGGSVVIALDGNVEVTSTGEGRAIGVAGLSSGADGGNDSGGGGGAGNINIRTEAVTVRVTASGDDDFGDDSFSNDFGKGDDFSQGEFGDSFDLPEDLVKGVTGVHALSWGHDGDSSADSDPGGKGGATGQAYIRNHGPVSVTLDTDGPMEELALSAGLFALSKAGDGGNASDDAGNVLSDGTKGAQAGTAVVHVHGSVSTGSNSADTGRYARIMGVYASSQGGDGGEGYDQGEGGDGGDGDTINVYTYPDSAISTQGDEAEGIFALSLGGKGGFQDPGFSVIGINTDAGEGGKGGDVLVKLGAPETTGGAIGGGRISTQGDFSTGVKAQSIGGPGGDADGGVAMFGSSNGDGGKGGPGGNVNVQSNSVIDTTGLRAIGILAESLGSSGGATDTGFTGKFAISGEGGAGAKGGDVSVTQSADLTTSGTASPGIAAHSVGGGGGAAGTTLGGIVAVGGQGGAGADAGDVSVALTGVSAVDENDGAGRLVDTQPVVTTHGDYSYGLAAQSIGGGGGDGGDVLAVGSVIPAVGIGGDGGGAGDGKSVQITLGDTGASQPGVRTYGDNAHAALGQSIGGGGGTGGDVRAAGISLTNFGMAGAADSGGDGGSVSYSSRLAGIQTTGGHANGVALRSVGGGGGSGGNASTLSASLFFGSALAIGGKGGDGGDGGIVSATVSGGEIETGTIDNSLVTDAHGLLAQSIGGGGGAGGSSMSRTFVLQFPTGPELPPIPGVAMSFAVGGSGGDGGDGGDTSVSLLDGGAINTIGDTSHGVFAQSIGGGGGIGGSGTAAGTVLKVPGSLLSATIDVAVGGTGGNGGDGGNVGVTLDGDISTQGAFANGVYVQSIGGGGGDASTGTADSLLFKGDIVDGVRTATQTLLKVPQYVFSNDQQAIDAAQSVTDDVVDGVVAAGGKVSSGEKLTTAKSTIRLPLEVTMEAQLGGKGGDGGHGGDVTLDLNNRSTIATAGDGAKGVLAQTIGGGGGVSQGATVGLGFGDFSDDSTLQSWLAQKFVIELGRTGAGAADGGNVTADIATPITTYGSGADGVLVQSIGGGGGVGGSVDGRSNSESGRFNPMSDPLTSGDSLIDTSVALGGRGGAGGDGGDFNDVRLAGDIRTGGDHARGVILQSIGGGGGLGGSGSSQDTFWLLRQFMTIGGTGGAGGNGGALDVAFDESDVQTAGFGSHGVLLQSIGAGGGIGGGGGRDSCEQVALGGGRRSDLATDKSEADPDAYASQAAACAVLSQNSSRTGSETGAQGASGDGGAIIANDGGQLTVTTSGDHAHGLVAQSVGGGGGLGASGATNLSSDPAGTKTSRNSFLQVGGFAPTGSDTVSGDGGTVDLSAAFSAQTLGDGSVGLLAQSIGGGGGLYDVDGVSRLNLGGVGATGEGGTVQVSTEAGSGFSTIGVGSHGVLAQSVGGGGGVVIGQLARNALNGTAPITLDVGGSDEASGNGGNVSVTHGEAGVDVSIRTANELARGLVAQSVGGGGGLFTSLYAGSDGPTVDTPLRVGGDSAGHGGEVSLRLTGNARTSGIGADAIVAQSVGGGGGIGDIADKDVGVNEVDITVGGSGGQTGDGSSVQVIFDGSNGGPIIQTQLNQPNTHAYGLLAQSVGGGGGLATDISFASEGSLKVGATGGSGGRGGSVNVSGSIGLLQNTGEDSHGIVAQSIGGGGGVGRLAAGDFSSAAGVDLTLGGEPTGSASAGNVSISVGVAPNPSSIIKTQGDRSIGILAQSIAGGGGIASTGTPQDKIRITTGGVSIGNTAGTVSVSLRDFGAADGIATFGAGSHGIVAQSIGGGGGLAGSSVLSSENMAGAIDTSGLTGRNSIGNGGAVSVDVESSVQTSGSNAYGIIAQSIGGGGGIFGVDGGVAGRNPAGSGRSSTVAVTLSETGEIRANGASGVGILAQSLGDDSGDQGAVTIDLDGILTATDYGVLINGGNSGNRITVGATGSLTSSNGKAVGIFDTGGGTLTLDNSGYISGNVEADLLQTASAARPASTASFSTASLSTASFAAVPASRIAVAPAAPAVNIVNREGGVLTGASRYDAHLTNHGRLEVGGTGSVAIAGDFTQSGTGETALGELVAGASGSRLQIGGDARLSGELSVSHANPAKGDVLRALEIGGTATGQFETVRFGVLEYSQKVENGVLSLTAERTRFGAPGAALTSQQAAVGHHLDAAFAAGNGASALTTQAIQISASAAAPQARLANFLTKLSPDAIIAPAALSVSRTADQFDALIGCGNRAHAAPDGDGCVKFDVSGGTFDQAATDGAVGFDADIYAVSAGMQAQISEDTSVGFTLGYENYDTSGETGRSSAETDAAVLGVSVTKQIGALELSFAGLGGYGWTDSSRMINVAGNSETASADYQSWTVAARGRAAFDLDMGGVTVTPAMDLDLIYAGHDGFSEQTGGAAGLTVEDGDQTVFRATPSVTLVGDFDLGGGIVVEPRASVGVSLASSDSYSFDAALSAAAPGAGTFESHVAMPNVAARAALGLAVELGGGAIIDLGYDGVFSSDTSASALSARLNWQF